MEEPFPVNTFTVVSLGFSSARPPLGELAAEDGAFVWTAILPSYSESADADAATSSSEWEDISVIDSTRGPGFFFFCVGEGQRDVLLCFCGCGFVRVRCTEYPGDLHHRNDMIT